MVTAQRAQPPLALRAVAAMAVTARIRRYTHPLPTRHMELEVTLMGAAKAVVVDPDALRNPAGLGQARRLCIHLRR